MHRAHPALIGSIPEDLPPAPSSNKKARGPNLKQREARRREVLLQVEHEWGQLPDTMARTCLGMVFATMRWAQSRTAKRTALWYATTMDMVAAAAARGSPLRQWGPYTVKDPDEALATVPGPTMEEQQWLQDVVSVALTVAAGVWYAIAPGLMSFDLTAELLGGASPASLLLRRLYGRVERHLEGLASERWSQAYVRDALLPPDERWALWPLIPKKSTTRFDLKTVMDFLEATTAGRDRIVANDRFTTPWGTYVLPRAAASNDDDGIDNSSSDPLAIVVVPEALQRFLVRIDQTVYFTSLTELHNGRWRPQPVVLVFRVMYTYHTKTDGVEHPAAPLQTRWW